MPSFTFDDDWFINERHRLLRSYATNRPRHQHHAVHHIIHRDPHFGEHVGRALRHLPPRHAGALRGHMQFYRAALLATGLLPADSLVEVAVQVEWFWYNTALVSAYRDHLAHVMKVATLALFLLQDPRSPLAIAGEPRLEQMAERLARNDYGSAAIRGAARRCGIAEPRLRDKAFWSDAVLETLRLSALLHDMAHPVVMARRMVSIASPVRPQAPFEPSEEELARHSVATFGHRLAASVFNRGELPGPDGLAPDDAAACAQAFLRGHSLPGAYAILRLSEQANRIWQLSSFDAFVLEWAALAVGVHQLDEIYFSDRRDEATSGRWLAVPANCEALRPSFKRDPVSYLLALCDTLQDFGRIQGSTTTRALDADRTESRVRYPCRAVELSLTLPGKRARAVFELGPDDGTCFGATEHDFEQIRALKERQARMLFGEDGWFDHGDLFTHLDVAVRWGSRLSGELSRPRPASRPAGGHDVFISYHSTDRVEVREIVARLRAEGLSVWFDEVDILPGTPWMPAIEAQIDTVAAAAVFFGASGKGTWQEEEVWALLPRLKKRGCPIIPVIMASCQGEPEISPFLGSRSAVDFRKSDPDPLHWLVRGIRGTP